MAWNILRKSLLAVGLTTLLLVVFFGTYSRALVIDGEGENARVNNPVLSVAYREVCTTHINGKELPLADCERVPVYYGKHLRVTHQRDLLWNGLE